MPTPFSDTPPSLCNDDARGPCAGGLVAGTLALMTTWAAPAPDAPLDVQRQRELIARKIVGNLALLRAHPDVGPALRQVIGKVGERWAMLARATDSATSAQDTQTPAVSAAALH